MLDVCLLGTGGTVPLPGRWLTSLYLNCAGSAVLIDCGEGTQIALHQQHISCKHIDAILFTHYHADHTAGLPGILLTMAKSDRTDPITIIGPKGLGEVLKGVMMIARYVPFEIRYMEFEAKEEQFDIGQMHFTAFALKHSVTCYGFEVTVNRTRRFDPQKAQQNDIPKRLWGILQKGQTVEHEGRTLSPEMVLGDERKGLKLVYATDTRPCEAIREHAKDADLFIGEGMYGDEEGSEKARHNKHMTMQESAQIARDANVKEHWFTHYSPSVRDPFDYEEEIHAICANTVIAKDGQRADLAFEHEETKEV